MGIIVFVSYATKDAEKFQIDQFVEKLKAKPEISEVMYWQKDAHGSLIKYMNKNVPRCDVFLLFCSPNTQNSKPIEAEWETAHYLGKNIIPISESLKFIPPLLRRFRAFQNIKNLVEAIYLEIVNILPQKDPTVKQKEKSTDDGVIINSLKTKLLDRMLEKYLSILNLRKFRLKGVVLISRNGQIITSHNIEGSPLAKSMSVKAAEHVKAQFKIGTFKNAMVETDNYVYYLVEAGSHAILVTILVNSPDIDLGGIRPYTRIFTKKMASILSGEDVIPEIPAVKPTKSAKSIKKGRNNKSSRSKNDVTT